MHTVQWKNGRSLRLSMRWEGPYVVVSHLNDVVVRIKKGQQAKTKVVHVNNIKKYIGDLRFDWFTQHHSEDNEEPADRPIPLCSRRAMHARSLVSKLLPRKMAVVMLAVLLGRINDYFLLNPRCDCRCFHRSM